LKIWGFTLKTEKRREEEQISIRELWHTIRNKIAHRNYKLTFQETSGVIHILVSFINEMLDILKLGKNS
jgi:hypothetical protein